MWLRTPSTTQIEQYTFDSTKKHLWTHRVGQLETGDDNSVYNPMKDDNDDDNNLSPPYASDGRTETS